MNLVRNAAGRMVPSDIGNGPFLGVGQFQPSGEHTSVVTKSCANYPMDGDKTTVSLIESLKKAGVKDGMTISTHHHFRNGDRVAPQLFAALKTLGIKDLRWFPSAVFPCHAELIPYLEDGTIKSIEGSLNGPLGEFASAGRMQGMAMLRSHGSRYRALQDGDVAVDIAVIAAPSCDPYGNMTGARGPAACGGLGFAVADANFARHVIAVSDNLVPFPCAPWQIAGNLVDQVVELEEIGDPLLIVSGTTEVTRSPERLLIAEYCARFVHLTGILQDGWSFQAGAGGTSLAFGIYAAEIMREHNIKCSFVRGGSNRYLVEVLEQGLTEFIFDGQTFDLEGVRSLRENERHIMTTPATSYNYHTKGNFASMLDCALLGATEVDLDFNANVVSHSDGRMLHGIGGWQDALFAKCTILAVPAFRGRVPIVRDSLTTHCGPSELIDVVVTELGIAINPQRADLIEEVKGKNLPLTSLEEVRAHAERLCGGPATAPNLEGDVVGLVTWVDGTILDTLRKIPERNSS